MKRRRIAAISLASLSLAALSPLAARAEAFSQQPLEGGGLMFQDLPGVHLDNETRKTPSGTCSEETVTSYRAGTNDTGTAQECAFGNFTIRTFHGNNSRLLPNPSQPFGEYYPPGEAPGRFSR